MPPFSPSMQTAYCDAGEFSKYVRRHFSGDESMRFRDLLVLSTVAGALSTAPGRADPCSPAIDRALGQVNAKTQAGSALARSVPQGTVALLHRQPTQKSITAAQETLFDVWLPIEAG